MAGRLDTRRHAPPVRIGRSQARTQQSQMLVDAGRIARGAGNYGQREARFASVPIALRIHRGAGPNTRAARSATIPIGHTRRKRGFPVPSLPQPGPGA